MVPQAYQKKLAGYASGCLTLTEFIELLRLLNTLKCV